MGLFVALVGLSVVSPCLGLGLRAGPLVPTDDPFYTQPQNISGYSPGQIIASRSVSTDLNGILGFSVTELSLQAAYQHLYRTTDSLQNPVAAVTTVLVPHNADPSKLLSYQTAYDSANINCGASYSLQAGANNTDVVDIIMITAALSKGFYVVSSDYEGPQGAFTSGLQAAYATLDSIRAVLSPASTALTGLSPAALYAMWGYSGGSLASEWAAELQPSYAPDLLRFQGAALGGLIGNVTSVVETINGGAFAGLAFAGIQGLASAYPDLAALLASSFASDAARARFDGIAAGCLVEALAGGLGQDLHDYFADFDGLLREPLVRNILDETGQMGQTGVPGMPLYVYKPAGDEVSPVADTDYVVGALCAQGATIEYRKNLVGEHSTEDILGSGKALAWIEDRLAGKAVASAGCVAEEVIVSSVDVDTLEAFGLELYSLLENVLGGRLGSTSLFPGRSVP